MNDTRTRYTDILRSGHRVRAEFDVFVGDLQDQITYLGFDLNPSAVASLKEDAAKLNEQARALFEKIDEVVNMTNKYIESIKPA